MPLTAQEITVVNRVPISPLGNGAHWWAHVATDPADSNRLIACATRTVAPTPNVWSSVYTSTNGGASWTETLTDSSSRWVTETSCAMGPGGAAYLVTGVSHEVDGSLDHPLGRLNLFRSTDEGRSWNLVNIRSFADYTSSIVNVVPGPEYGRLVIAANKVAALPGNYWSRPMVVLTSPDLGETLTGPVVRPSDAEINSNDGSYPTGITLLSDGRAVVIYAVAQGSRKPEEPSSREYQLALIARDGATIEHVRPIPDTSSAIATPTIAVDRTGPAHRGRLYVTWTEKRDTTERIVLAMSDDEGVTWTRREIREHGIGSVAHDGRAEGALALLNPAIGVNSAGIVGLVWTDYSSACTRFAASTDGGDTFSPAVKLSRCNGRIRGKHYLERVLYPMTTGRGPGGITLVAQFDFGGGAEFGQTNLAADAAGRFHPVWAEPDDLGYQLWTATVMEGASPVGGKMIPADLKALTPDIGMQIERAGYAEADSTFFVDLRLVNRSSRAICAPVFIEGRSLSSRYGAPSFANADNRIVGDGALWDASSLLEQGTLLPGALSELVHIAVRVDDFPPVRVPAYEGPFSATFRIFGRESSDRCVFSRLQSRHLDKYSIYP